MYPARASREPVSKMRVPFGSVTTNEEWSCMRFGLTKNLVFPEPLPPITRIFLFLAYFGSLGRLDMVSRSV